MADECDPGQTTVPGELADQRYERELASARRVVVWRSSVISPSETFMRNQVDAMSRWSPTLVGAKARQSSLSRPDDVIVFGDTRREEVLRRSFTLTGRSPRVRQMLRRLKPELVHAHFIDAAWTINREVTELGVPLMTTAHGYDATNYPAQGGLRGVRARRHFAHVVSRSTLVLAVSNYLRDRLIENGAEPERVVVHRIGIPIFQIQEAQRQRWDIAFVGRFVEKKGVLDLIRAVAALPAARPASVVLVGEGPMRAAAEDLARELRVNATFLGTRTSAEVRSVLASSSIFAAPSRRASNGDSEGLPTVVLEASAAGLPVVATTHAGIPEAVVNRVTGLLSTEGDVAALSRNLSELLESPAARRDMGAAARDHVAREFDIRKQTKRLESIYDLAIRAHEDSAPIQVRAVEEMTDGK
jgi:glycosyltransferase involved in cell wall biosynthesis